MLDIAAEVNTVLVFTEGIGHKVNVFYLKVVYSAESEIVGYRVRNYHITKIKVLDVNEVDQSSRKSILLKNIGKYVKMP